jgi:lipopolysaccharide transport system ATP-binding protein
MLSNNAIKISNLSKCYHIYDKPHHRLLQMLTRGRRRFHRDFWALRDVSFEVGRGETVGIIGRNGSGKSTLLQLICGTLAPTNGTVEVTGRIAALLELGSGFNPEFTGKENVLLSAALLGLRRDEIERHYDDILEFADIGEFIDQPVKTYSSGMVVRLAFAVQAQLSPDILIVDEALAVGDARFQAKCFARLNQLKDQGTSILLVTHSSEQIVSHCSRAILLDRGCLVDQGEPRSVVNHYLDILFSKENSSPEPVAAISQSLSSEIPGPSSNLLSDSEELFSSRAAYNPNEYRWGSGGCRILDFYLTNKDYLAVSAFDMGERIKLGLSIIFVSEVTSYVIGITIKTQEGITIYGTNTDLLQTFKSREPGRAGTTIKLEAEFNCILAPGDYFISVGIAARDGEEVVPLDRRYDSIHVKVLSSKRIYGLVDLDLTCSSIGSNT